MKRIGMPGLALLLAQPLWACAGLETSDAWVRAAPPTAQVMAGYLTLANRGDQVLRIDGVSAQGFERAELHQMTHVDGVMRMRRLDGIDIAPGERVELAPGGRHLMLFDPIRTVAAGEEIEIELRCGAATHPLRLPVREGG